MKMAEWSEKQVRLLSDDHLGTAWHYWKREIERVKHGPKTVREAAASQFSRFDIEAQRRELHFED